MIRVDEAESLMSVAELHTAKIVWLIGDEKKRNGRHKKEGGFAKKEIKRLPRKKKVPIKSHQHVDWTCSNIKLV